MTEVQPDVKYPKRVDSESQVHFALYGPPQSGKSHVALHINTLYDKCIVNLDEIVDWHINMGTEIG